MIRSNRLLLAAIAATAASSLTVLAQAPADAGAANLPRPAHGTGAIALLGDDLASAAESNGLGAAELRELLRQDLSALLDRNGRLFFTEPTVVGDPHLVEGSAPFPSDQTFLLHSRPESTHVIFLDFDGTTVSGTGWNAAGALPNGFYSGYSLDGDHATFNDTERDQIQSIWQRVSEDFSAFDVDVTTQDPGDAAIDRTDVNDVNFGTRALITDETTDVATICPPGCGGVAYFDVFDKFGSGIDAHSYSQPAWIFGGHIADHDTKDIADTISHEVGHTFALLHDGVGSPGSGCISAPDYYCGHAMWAPIMGYSHDRPVVQWSDGNYTFTNITQDDLGIIASNGAPLIADDAGGTIPTASSSIAGPKHITSASDQDVYLLGHCTGALTVAAGPPAPATPSPDLDIRLDLIDGNGTVVATDDPPSTLVDRDRATGLSASVSATVPPGSYFVRVDGVGIGDGSTGYSDYASIGAYALTIGGSGSCTTVPGGPAPATTPGAPGVGKARSGKKGGKKTASVSWRAPASDGGSPVIGWQVLVYKAGGALTKTVTGLAAGTTTYTFKGKPGKYRFAIVAVNAIGAGPASAQTKAVRLR